MHQAERRRRAANWAVVALLAAWGWSVWTMAMPLPARAAPTTPPPGWELAFADEFDGVALDRRRWATRFPWGRDRSQVGELQLYAGDALSVADGRLRIEARQHDGTYRYLSGLVSSHPSFAQEYGWFELRARLPRGQGLWPAFWLLPPDGAWPPEIDVMEGLGSRPDTVFMNVIWPAGDGVRQQMGRFVGPDFAAGFHTFAVDWRPDEIVWYVDGVERHRVVGKSPRGPMYVLANLAVGGEWPGEPDASTVFPAAFEIDYIRVYRPRAADPPEGVGGAVD